MPDMRLRERVKPGLVKAWFRTVINPIIAGLEAEADLLRRDDYTWRAYARRLAGFAPVRSQVAEIASPNLDQFLRVYPEFQPLFEDHDEKLRVLFEKVSEYASALDAYSPLRQMAAHLIDKTNPGFSNDEEAVSVAAEYVVNGVTHLPNYYSTAQFWNSHSRQFLDLRDHPEISPFRESAHVAALTLKQSADDLAGALKAVRDELSFDMDVPPVER
jgi:hypothetical protein